MKVLFLHGAVKNAGDFLIANRSRKLIESIVPNCEVISRYEKTDFYKDENKKILEECNCIVFGGGPFFTHNIYPSDIPLLEDLSAIKKPMINIGGGWFGKDNEYKTVKGYEIDATSFELLDKIYESAGTFSCRDWYTVGMIREKGYTSAEMHGCPAWYDLNYINNLKLNRSNINEIRKICVSDPARDSNDELIIPLLEFIRNKYKNAVIEYIFHRHIRPNFELDEYLKNNNILSRRIADGYEGFSCYDDCQLHIGFRVHAHIYNLSHRNLSILIEEDGRGAGVDQALGLSQICSYKKIPKTDMIEEKYVRNYDFTNEIDLYLKRILDTNGIDYEQAFVRMNLTFEKMKKHIAKINEWK